MQAERPANNSCRGGAGEGLVALAEVAVAVAWVEVVVQGVGSGC